MFYTRNQLLNSLFLFTGNFWDVFLLYAPSYDLNFLRGTADFSPFVYRKSDFTTLQRLHLTEGENVGKSKEDKRMGNSKEKKNIKQKGEEKKLKYI